MIQMYINDKKVDVNPNYTILQACESVGLEIPRFCYHDRLSIAGNCRMCLIEIQHPPSPKPLVASCAWPVSEGLKIQTSTDKVKKAREGILEFLLLNHPLDCPVCDQGGECDLQDQSMVFGNDRGRFYDTKRAVEDKDLGPLVKTTMTRCIHCTRCVRFATEIAGISDLGVTGRGSKMEIGTYIKKVVKSELSGNIIDLCPVGALTSKPYAFVARPWELKSTPSIDIFDALGSNIRIDTRGNDIMRILPRLNECINEEWISDKVRFSYDALKLQRLDIPMIRKNNQLVGVSWKEAFEYIVEALKTRNTKQYRLANFEVLENNKMTYNFKPFVSIQGFAGPQVDAEALLVFKDLLSILGSKSLTDIKTDQKIDLSLKSNYLFNSSIVGIERADLCLLINTNPRIEAPVLNARIRQAVLNNNLKVYNIGEQTDLTYPVYQLGNNFSVLNKLLNGNHWVCQELSKSKNPMIIIGEALLSDMHANSLLNNIKNLAKYTNLYNKEDNWVGFNILATTASITAQNELNFSKFTYKNQPKFHADIIYSLGYDSTDLVRDKNRFIIYQGHHGDLVANHADVILPGVTPMEKNGLFLNLESYAQKSRFVLTPPGYARTDWKILKALHLHFKEIGFLEPKAANAMDYLTLDDVRKRLLVFSPAFIANSKANSFDTIFDFGFNSFNSINTTSLNFQDIGNKGFVNKISNFYMTDSISRSSKVMAECTKSLQNI